MLCSVNLACSHLEQHTDSLINRSTCWQQSSGCWWRETGLGWGWGRGLLRVIMYPADTRSTFAGWTKNPQNNHLTDDPNPRQLNTLHWESLLSDWNKEVDETSQEDNTFVLSSSHHHDIQYIGLWSPLLFIPSHQHVPFQPLWSVSVITTHRQAALNHSYSCVITWPEHPACSGAPLHGK